MEVGGPWTLEPRWLDTLMRTESQTASEEQVLQNPSLYLLVCIPVPARDKRMLQHPLRPTQMPKVPSRPSPADAICLLPKEGSRPVLPVEFHLVTATQTHMISDIWFQFRQKCTGWDQEVTRGA